ncbi:hypothetical protein EYC84_000803 [Monilinia fructicola]|uniref:Uncharacterized protein n=1 Tax=Monilinia fructicola TaxID=38448 RepID=A0A5M9JL61_MONFR|nr:hypothetical protein EYC84_000803 [Monilinia fructicola]
MTGAPCVYHVLQGDPKESCGGADMHRFHTELRIATTVLGSEAVVVFYLRNPLFVHQAKAGSLHYKASKSLQVLARIELFHTLITVAPYNRHEIAGVAPHEREESPKGDPIMVLGGEGLIFA